MQQHAKRDADYRNERAGNERFAGRQQEPVHDVFLDHHPLERKQHLRRQRDDVSVDRADADQSFKRGAQSDQRGYAKRRGGPSIDAVHLTAGLSAQMLLVVTHAATRLFAQIVPDLRDVPSERCARHDFGGPRSR